MSTSEKVIEYEIEKLNSKTDPSNSYKATLPPNCEGCGGIAHGSVNAERNCILAALSRARSALHVANRTIEAQRIELAPFRKIREEVAQLAPAWPPSRP